VSTSYFEFYNLEEQFFIDESSLKQTYLKLSKEHHPDFYIDDEEKYDAALELTSTNNMAFKVLKSLDNRIPYILRLNNTLTDKDNNLPSEFLMEMMDVNEEIMDLKMDFDADKLRRVKNQVDGLSQEWNQKIKSLAKLADSQKGEERGYTLKKIKEFYLKRKYVLRLIESLNTFAPH
jgi:molecular chaperone HscB